MYIGCSRDCKEYCKESSKAYYESDHSKQKHTIFDIKTFKDDNKDYILRIQRAWQPFDKQLQNFFSTLRKEIDWIEKDAQSRLLEEELKTAINSDDKRLIELSRTIFNEKFDRVTCKEIDEFLDIKQRQQNNRNFLRIQKKEELFALDILNDIKKATNDIGKSLTNNKNRDKGRQHETNTPKDPPKKAQNHNDGRKDRRNKQEFKNDKQEPTNKGRNIREEREEREDRRANREANKQKAENKKKIERQDQPRREERRREDARDNRRTDRETDRQKNREARENRRGQIPREQRRPDKQRKDNAGKEPKAKKIYKKMKIIELKEGSDEFSIDLKLVSLLKNLKDRDIWKASDATGEIKLVIPEHESFKVGTSMTLNNCFVRTHGQELEIVARMFSTITSPEIGNDVDVGSLIKNNPRKPRQNKQRFPQSFPNFTKIADLEPGQQGLKLIAKVINVVANKNSIECVLGDQTGIVNARFNVGNQFLKVSNTVYMRDIDVEITGESEGSIIIVPGSKFLIENARDQIKKVKEENNISKRIYQAFDD